MNQDYTQPIRPDADATVIMVHPDHMPVAPPPPAPRSRAWIALFAAIGALLFAAGAVLGAFVVSGTAPTEAELDQARQEAVDEGFADGYDEGYDDAEAEAKTEITDAYRSGYEEGFDAGASSRADQPPAQDKPNDANQGTDKADKE
jgi:hypothetical protein